MSAVPSLPSAFVPSISHGGYGYKGAGGVSRSSVAGGRGRYARSYSNSTRMFQVSFFLRDASKILLWELFYVNSIQNGALAFSMPLNSGMGVLPHIVNMIPESLSINFIDSDIATVGFSVEAEPSSYAYVGEGGQSLTDVIIAYGDDAAIVLNQIHILANIDSNVLNF